MHTYICTLKNDVEFVKHNDQEMEYDEVNDQLIITGYSQIPKAGFTSWKTKRPDQAQAQVKIFRKGEKKKWQVEQVEQVEQVISR